MTGRETTPSPRRAVIFTSHAVGRIAPAGPQANLECVVVASAYEACAELLADPAAVLVIDLRLLRPCHVRLIELARRAGAELLGVGPLPAWANSDQLGGLRLLGQGQLAEALQTLAGDSSQGQHGTYEHQTGPRQDASAEPAPLLSAEELRALLGDVT